jgi:hypothetical protein
MPFNICDKTMECALWIMSIGQQHHCVVIENPHNINNEYKQPKTTFLNPKNFYGKFK